MMLPLVCLAAALTCAAEMERIAVSDDGRGFVFAESRRPFVVRGFNYDHDERGRLLEDYWVDEWPKVAEDFAEMRELGATVVRVHLQFGKFMETADRPNAAAVERLQKLLALAERERLYLDLTGLGCYHKADVPAWYDALDEEARWNAQAKFWEVIAAACAKSPAVFCYDLMNEPIVPAGKRAANDWLGPAFGGKHFVQLIALTQGDRTRPAIARAWIEKLAAAVRKQDAKRLVTVGLVDWSLDRPGLTSGFVPKEVAGPLDFVCVHLYPETGKGAEAIETLKAFGVGKPVVIEETFPLKSSLAEFEQFLDDAQPHSAGVIGFYWGKPPAELKKSTEIGDAILLRWLELFQQRAR